MRLALVLTIPARASAGLSVDSAMGSMSPLMGTMDTRLSAVVAARPWMAEPAPVALVPSPVMGAIPALVSPAGILRPAVATACACEETHVPETVALAGGGPFSLLVMMSTRRATLIVPAAPLLTLAAGI